MSCRRTSWAIALCTTVFVVAGAIASYAGELEDLEQENKKAVMQAVELMNTGDYGELGRFIASDYRRHSQATPEAVVNSLDDFIALLQHWDNSFTEVANEVHALIAEGDLVAIYGTYSGVHTGPMGPFAATGKKMSSDYAGYHRMKDGKIVETWVTWDNIAIFGQLGISPCPEETPKGD